MATPITVTVLGAGSWGTTVAHLAAQNVETVLWARNPDTAAEVNEQSTNSSYLGDRKLAESLRATADLEEAVSQADVLVCGIPTQSMREVCTEAGKSLRPWVPIVSLAKGLEQETRKRPTEILTEVFEGHPIALLAGPNLAAEIVDGLAAAAVVATPDTEVAKSLQPLFHTNRFRVYRNRDVLGSELGGVLKNIVAIATGMADGLSVGDNTRAMVITRGLAEIIRLGEAMGAYPHTFSGLTGLGDLMATCMSPLSRNRRVGEELGKGKKIEQIIEEMNQVAEGVKTARPVMELAAEHDVVMPIAAEVDQVVNEGGNAEEAYRGLMRGGAHHERTPAA